MCAKIRRVIDDIVREDEDYEVLEEEDLRNWEDENDYYLPNDMREYFKVIFHIMHIYRPNISKLSFL